MKNEDLQRSLMSFTNPHNLFAKSVVRKLEDNTPTNAIVQAECQQGHNFSLILSRTVATLFNVMVKNYVLVRNDKLHASKKRSQISNHGLQTKFGC